MKTKNENTGVPYIEQRYLTAGLQNTHAFQKIKGCGVCVGGYIVEGNVHFFMVLRKDEWSHLQPQV